MDVPGCRHNAECRQNQAEYNNAIGPLPAEPELFVEPQRSPRGGEPNDEDMSPVPSPSTPAASPNDDVVIDDAQVDGEAPAVVGEANMEVDGFFVDLDVPFSLDFLMNICCQHDFMLESQLNANSVTFDSAQGYEAVKFCGTKVRAWRFSGAVSETTLADLDAEGTFKAMVKELKGLDEVKAGRVMTEVEAR